MAVPRAIALPAAALGALLVGALAVLVPGLRSGADRGGEETGLSLTSLLGDSGAGAGSGFLKVEGPRPFAFPADHGPHPGYRSEWWYFTGNLRDTLGREWGFQLTFFRSALRPPDSGTGRSSPWAAGDAWMAHFALSEPGGSGGPGGRFRAFERFSRGALGLAGARATPFRVWLEDWIAASEGGGTALLPLRLRASQGGAAIDLRLGTAKPLALQGDRGYSPKGPGKGNASHYYSFTRMPAEGEVMTPAGRASVRGSAWMDREWGSSILSPGLSGWDWFGLQLEDGTDWLFFRLRAAGREAAERDSAVFDYGMRVGPDGTTRRLGPGDLRAEVLDRWTSPVSGRRYPSRWRISVPSESLVMTVEPKLADQELRLSIPYWEGAVRIEARKDDHPVRGHGYMELTGY